MCTKAHVCIDAAVAHSACGDCLLVRQMLPVFGHEALRQTINEMPVALLAKTHDKVVGFDTVDKVSVVHKLQSTDLLGAAKV